MRCVVISRNCEITLLPLPMVPASVPVPISSVYALSDADESVAPHKTSSCPLLMTKLIGKRNRGDGVGELDIKDDAINSKDQSNLGVLIDLTVQRGESNTEAVILHCAWGRLS